MNKMKVFVSFLVDEDEVDQFDAIRAERVAGFKIHKEDITKDSAARLGKMVHLALIKHLRP